MINSGALNIAVLALSLFDETLSFDHQTRFVSKHCSFKKSLSPANRSGTNHGPSSIYSISRGCEEGIDDSHSACPTVLRNCNVEQQHDLCEDVDKVMEGLVSPAPESFYVLNSVISKINYHHLPRDDTFSPLDDLKALSSYLVKVKYAIELYLDIDVYKWRLVPRENSKLGAIYPREFIREGNTELYHEHNTLQLSRIALDLATNGHDSQILTKIQAIAGQAEKRLALTMGSDLRGPTSSDACFNFALAGLQHSCSLFRTLACIGVHELKRAGLRSSFQPKHILHMVEKFAACDIHGQHALDLYQAAGVCLEKKDFEDTRLIEDLKGGSFGFHCDRPLLWLWRHSSRRKKVSRSVTTSRKSAVMTSRRSIEWNDIFDNTSKPLVVDIGSGMGASLLNLSTLSSDSDGFKENSDRIHGAHLPWSEMNYAGADLDQAMVNFGNGIVSRDTSSQRKGRVHFFYLSAGELLDELQFYPGKLALIMTNFPTPYRLEVYGAGNMQLPSKHSDRFMLTKQVLTSIGELLSESSAFDREEGGGIFLFQTKCEDVAVHVKNECLSLGTMECLPCKNPVEDIDRRYVKSGKRPKRVNDWMKATSSAERAEGNMYSSTPLLPSFGRPETEVQCIYDHTVIHRCLFRRRRTQ